MKLPLPLSVAIIAKNEERNIKRCLASLGGIASEIILVYNDCTDKTVEVAKSFGAKCIGNEWCGHIEQKNFALLHCTQEWVLCLDADEAISAILLESITDFINNHNEGINGASFNRCTYFLGKWIRHGDWYPDKKLRVIRRGFSHWEGINPHDKLVLSEIGRVIHLKGDLEHFSFDSLRDFSEKTLHYSDIYIQNLGKTNSTAPRLINAVFRACWRFLRCYFLRLGFMDGCVGFIIAMLISYETLLRHARKWELTTNYR
jgi:glycosyltransferase involved in cell wall biosynthesis